jgi:hypothetical protein
MNKPYKTEGVFPINGGICEQVEETSKPAERESFSIFVKLQMHPCGLVLAPKACNRSSGQG